MSNEIWVDLLMGTSEDRRNFSEVKAEMLTQEKIESLVMGCFEVNRIINYQAKRIDEEFDLVRSNAAIDEKKPTNLRHRVRVPFRMVSASFAVCQPSNEIFFFFFAGHACLAALVFACPLLKDRRIVL